MTWKTKFKNLIFAAIGLIIVALLILLIFSRSGENENQNFTENENRNFTIVTSFYPPEYFAREITGGRARVINIGMGGDPHDFNPTAQDIIKMQTADLVILQGGGFEPWGEDIEGQLSNAGVPVLVILENEEAHENEDEDAHENENEDAHENEDENENAHENEDEHGHAHGAIDPHTWLDPILAQEMVDDILAAILALPDKNFVAEDTKFYQDNAENLKARLDALHAAYRASFQSLMAGHSHAEDALHCKTQEAIISHDAFGYVAKRYGMVMHPIAGLSTQDEPSAKLLAELKMKAGENVLAILTDATSVKNYAKTLARETGLALISIHPIASGVFDGQSDYFIEMRRNLEALKRAFGCE